MRNNENLNILHVLIPAEFVGLTVDVPPELASTPCTLGILFGLSLIVISFKSLRNTDFNDTKDLVSLDGDADF